MLVAVAALVVAVGGTGYAASQLPRNSVGSAQLRANAVVGAKLAPGAVTGRAVRDGSLAARDFAPGQLPRGEPGPAGPAGEVGPSTAFTVIGPSPVAIPGGQAVTVASMQVPSGAYTFAATGFIFTSGDAVGMTDQFICSVVDGSGQVVAGMPSQVTLPQASGQQYNLIGAGTVAAGPLTVRCSHIVATGDGADPDFQQIGARLVATRVGSVVRP
jgi:hypothetical protein